MQNVHLQEKGQTNITTKKCNKLFIFSVPRKIELNNSTSGTGFIELKVAMVRVRIRREPWGETKNWKEKEKVWHKLKKGGITRFMEKLHGFDAGVTKVMVET